MKEWIKAVKFAMCFMSLSFLFGFFALAGAHGAAKLVGVSVVIAVDEDAGGEQ